MKKIIYSLLLLLLGNFLYGENKTLLYFESCPSLKDDSISKSYYSISFDKDDIISELNWLELDNDDYLNIDYYSKKDRNEVRKPLSYDFSKIQKMTTIIKTLYKIKREKDYFYIYFGEKELFSFSYNKIDETLKELEKTTQVDIKQMVYTDNIEYTIKAGKSESDYYRYKIADNAYEVYDLSQGYPGWVYKNLYIPNYKLNDFSEKAAKINKVIYEYISKAYYLYNIYPFITNYTPLKEKTFNNANTKIVCKEKSILIDDKQIEFNKIKENQGMVILSKNNKTVAEIVQRSNFISIYVPDEKQVYFGTTENMKIEVINPTSINSTSCTINNNSYKYLLFVNGSYNTSEKDKYFRIASINIKGNKTSQEYMTCLNYTSFVQVNISELTGKSLELTPTLTYSIKDPWLPFTNLVIGLK